MRRLSRRCFARFGDRLVLPAYGSLAGGLWVTDPAFAAALGGPPEALVPTGAGLLRIEGEDLAA
jgi:metallophosphoesterase superfamily enzyme